MMLSFFVGAFAIISVSNAELQTQAKKVTLEEVISQVRFARSMLRLGLLFIDDDCVFNKHGIIERADFPPAISHTDTSGIRIIFREFSSQEIFVVSVYNIESIWSQRGGQKTKHWLESKISATSLEDVDPSNEKDIISKRIISASVDKKFVDEMKMLYDGFDSDIREVNKTSDSCRRVRSIILEKRFYAEAALGYKSLSNTIVLDNCDAEFNGLLEVGKLILDKSQNELPNMNEHFESLSQIFKPVQ